MQSRFLQKFRRITYSTSYLPEIDGLRFLAIFSVAVIMHITHYLDTTFYSGEFIQNSYWKNFTAEGGSGVPLFFAISGFILSLPFAKWRLNGEKKVGLRNYYVRRVTRLEPPYIIALLILFIVHVWILHSFSFNALLPHLVASVFYLHFLLYHSFSWVLPISWSLEVEVQFYILAPFFFLVYLVRPAIIRWIIYLLIILGNAVYWFDVWNQVHVLRFLHLFFIGIFLSDLYCSGIILIKNRLAGAVAGICALIGFLFVPSIHILAGNLFKLTCIFLLMHTVLTNPVMKKIFSLQGIVLIGGMCYSIYLLHFAVISAIGHALNALGIKSVSSFYFLPLALVFITAVLLVSIAYFILIEKPFMKPMGLFKRAKQ